MKAPRFIAILTLLALALVPLIAAAASPLVFDDDLSGRQKLLINNHFKNLGGIPADMAVALIDLNEDGIEEFIVRSNCENGGENCVFTILAETEGNLTELGSIKAHELGLGDAYARGVRNIIAYDNGISDFKRSVYIWEPQAGRYIIKK